MTDSFPPIAFQSALSIEAVLFVVFGFLYSVYAMYSVNIERPPVVGRLRVLCRVVAGLSGLNAALLVLSLAMMNISPVGDKVLAGGFVVTMITIAGISLWWAFRTME